jgi:iron(III) transport system substrate-binding protein
VLLIWRKLGVFPSRQNASMGVKCDPDKSDNLLGVSMKKHLLATAVALLPLAAQAQQGQVNIICSVQAEQCNLVQTVFAKTTGIKVNLTHKASGEAMAQLNAEKANPKTDVWYGGTGDPHMQAAELGLTLEYKSTTLPQLYDWAQKQAAQTGYKTVGIYSGPL